MEIGLDSLTILFLLKVSSDRASVALDSCSYQCSQKLLVMGNGHCFCMICLSASLFLLLEENSGFVCVTKICLLHHFFN